MKAQEKAGGPRVTSGANSKQDYETPDLLMAPVQARFGKVTFDLAAHAKNKKHERYFAPPFFTETFEKGVTSDTYGESELEALIETMIGRGVHREDAEQVVRDSRGKALKALVFKNSDAGAYKFDAMAHKWTELGGGLLWLNCEFGDITPWAKRCSEEGQAGANIVLLVPAMIANWARDYVFPFADVYFLNGRISFDGKNVFPKDCMIAHYHVTGGQFVNVWDWRKGEMGELHGRWSRSRRLS